MRSRIRWLLVLVTLLCLGCGCGSAESRYQALCSQNGLSSTDVIAWLEVPGASICEPVMRHAQDDTYYAKHAADGQENAFGALYVQAGYNASDFSDPVTIIYGSSVSEKAPFGKLQELYSGSFQQCTTVWLHMPEESCEYEVFAAVPHSSIHILYYYDFSSERRYNGFFDNVFSTRALGMHLDEDKRPVFGEDSVVILSTGLRGDSLQRYLVMARKQSSR